mgnify:CR=1 FL=1
MNADAGNLPDMLRQPDGVVFVKDVNMSGVTGPEIGHELAALVEAADVVCDSDSPGASAHDLWRYETARAALVAKIGGKG